MKKTTNTMNASILEIIQNYINVIEGLFDRDVKQLSLQEYEEYLKAIKDCRVQNVFPSVSREKEIEEYVDYETQM